MFPILSSLLHNDVIAPALMIMTIIIMMIMKNMIVMTTLMIIAHTMIMTIMTEL